jgi:glycosyltransferase involved in cell wall biosynthesis
LVPWSAAGELAALHSFDIGVMPLADDDWCRGKCGFKLIQYMAVGLPVIGSAVGFNRDVVRDGTDGFLVSSGGWFEALRLLLSDDDLRLRMGRAGRSRVESDFRIERATETYDRLLRSLQ